MTDARFRSLVACGCLVLFAGAQPAHAQVDPGLPPGLHLERPSERGGATPFRVPSISDLPTESDCPPGPFGCVPGTGGDPSPFPTGPIGPFYPRPSMERAIAPYVASSGIGDSLIIRFPDGRVVTKRLEAADRTYLRRRGFADLDGGLYEIRDPAFDLMRRIPGSRIFVAR